MRAENNSIAKGNNCHMQLKVPAAGAYRFVVNVMQANDVRERADVTYAQEKT